MAFQLSPRRGLDAILIGMAMERVEAEFGPGEKFRRTEEAPVSFLYPALGLIVTMGPEGHVIEIEAGSPASVQFRGVELIGAALGDVTAGLETMGYLGTYDGDAVVEYEDLGLALYVPAGFDLSEPVEGITVHP